MFKNKNSRVNNTTINMMREIETEIEVTVIIEDAVELTKITMMTTDTVVKISNITKKKTKKNHWGKFLMIQIIMIKKKKRMWNVTHHKIEEGVETITINNITNKVTTRVVAWSTNQKEQMPTAVKIQNLTMGNNSNRKRAIITYLKTSQSTKRENLSTRSQRKMSKTNNQLISKKQKMIYKNNHQWNWTKLNRIGLQLWTATDHCVNTCN